MNWFFFRSSKDTFIEIKQRNWGHVRPKLLFKGLHRKLKVKRLITTMFSFSSKIKWKSWRISSTANEKPTTSWGTTSPPCCCCRRVSPNPDLRSRLVKLIKPQRSPRWSTKELESKRNRWMSTELNQREVWARFVANKFYSSSSD